MAQAHAGVSAPDHVPPNLVRPYPFAFGATTEREPFEALVPEIHRGPEVFYGLNAYPGGAGASSRHASTLTRSERFWISTG